MNKTQRRTVARRSTEWGYLDRGTTPDGRVFEVTCPVKDCDEKVRAVRWAGAVRTPREQCKALHDEVEQHLAEVHP